MTVRESEDHQKMTSSESLKIIGNWSSTEFEDWKLGLVKSCYYEDTSLQKEWKPEATTISDELEGIGCLSTEEHRKKAIVQLYNHYSTPHACSSTRLQLFLHWLFSIQGMDLKLFSPRTITKSSNISLVNDQASQRLFWCAGNQQRLSHTSI